MITTESAMLTGYLACALWLATDGERGEINLDESHTIKDFSADSRAAAEHDCATFLVDNAELIERGGQSFEQVGHDFWLTRNHHGAGFWDRGLGAVGDLLTEAARAYGEKYVYVGDDGKLHIA